MSSTINDCANGSTHQVCVSCLCSVILLVFDNILESDTALVVADGTRVERKTSSVLSTQPVAVYCASVFEVAAVISLLATSVKFNTLVPVVKFNPELFGTKNVPSILPAPSEIKSELPTIDVIEFKPVGTSVVTVEILNASSFANTVSLQ